jgi:epoxyqueuosine reductase
MPAAAQNAETLIAEKAQTLGFAACGFAPAHLGPEARARLQAFIAAGQHGDMGWLADRLDQRSHPRALWPEARSVVVLGMSYAPPTDPLATLGRPNRGNISVYARNRDYHDVIKGRLKLLTQFMISRCGGEAKLFVDTAPVMEKPLAEQAALGWQGKHTNLLDATRCLSYLTIEHRGPIPHALRPAMGNRIYGCDDCLAVCPWNKFAQAASEAKLQPLPEREAPRLAELAALDDTGFRTMFAGSPIKRTGRDRFVRNVAVAIGNSADPSLIPAAQALAADSDPVVAEAAQWALQRLC